MRLGLFLILLAFASCKCPQLILQADSIHDTSYVEKHTTDTLWKQRIIRDTINLSYLCDSLRSIDRVIFLSHLDHLTSSISVNRDKLVIICQADSLQRIIDSLVLVKQRTELKTNTVDIKIHGWFDKMTNYIFWILIGSLAVVGGWKFLKSTLI